MLLIYSPLEQFDFIFFSSFLNKFYIVNIVIISLIICLFILLFILILDGRIFFFSFFQIIFEFFYIFIYDMLRQQVGDLGKKYYIIIFSIFFLIISSNLLGMLPFGFTLTAHLSLTFFLAFSVNLGLIVLGFYKNKFNFLLLFVPKGAPLFLMPLIVVIEVVSYLIRTFSLSIRLFANMMAGHCSLFVISMFIFILVDFYSHLVMFPIFMIYVLIFILEFAIAVLQAYVFTILVCIYLNDSLHPVH